MTVKSFKTYYNTPLTYKIQKPRHWYIEKNITPLENMICEETLVPYEGLDHQLKPSYIEIKNQKLWNNENIDQKHYALAPIKKEYYNFELPIGVNVNTGLASFSGSNYLKTFKPFNPQGKHWKVFVKFTTGDSVSSNQKIFQSYVGKGESGRFGILLYIMNGYMRWAQTVSGTSWLFDITDDKYPLQPNTTYYFDASWDGSTYKLSLSEDGIRFVELINYNDSTPMCNLSYTHFGVYSTSSIKDYFTGTIDFAETYLEIDNKKVWTGQSDVNYLAPTPKPNYNVIGSLTNNYGVVRGFNSSNYITTNYKFLPENNPWVWQVKFKQTTSFSGSVQYIMNSSYYTKAPYITILADNKLNVSLTSNGQYITGVSSTFKVDVGKDYWVRLEYDGNGVYTVKYSLDGKTYNILGTMENNTTIVSTDVIWFGKTGHDTYLYGEIDFNETFIKINDEIVWSANQPKLCEVVGSPTITNNIMSGFTNTNYGVIGTLPLGSAKSWEMMASVVTGDDVTTPQSIFAENNAGYYGCVTVEKGKFLFNLSATHSSYIFPSTIYSVSDVAPNTAYLVKIKYDSDIYTLETSIDDGKTWILEGTAESTIRTTDWQWNIGCSNTGGYQYPFKGSIVLDKSYVKINYDVVWGEGEPLSQLENMIGCIDDEYKLYEKTYTSFINNDSLILNPEDNEIEDYIWANSITIPELLDTSIYQKRYQECNGKVPYTTSGKEVWANLNNKLNLHCETYIFDPDMENSYEYKFLCKAKTGSSVGLQVLCYMGTGSWYGLDSSGKFTQHNGLSSSNALTTNTEYWFAISETYDPATAQYTHKIMYIKDDGYTRYILPGEDQWSVVSDTNTTNWFKKGSSFIRLGDLKDTAGYSWFGLINLTNTYILYNDNVVWQPLERITPKLDIVLPGGGDVVITPTTPSSSNYYAFTPASNSFLTTINNNEGGNYNTDVFYASSSEIGTHQKLYMLNSSNNKMIEITNLELKITDSSIGVYPFTSGPSFFQPVALTTATRTQSKDLLGSEVEGIEDTCTYMPSYN